MLEGGIRALVRRNRLAVAAELVTEPSEDALIAGATSIADIDKLMGEADGAQLFAIRRRAVAPNDRLLHPSCPDRISLG